MYFNRVLSNGDLLFRDKVPDSLEGYEQDENDPKLFRLVYLDCKYRQDKQIVLPCKRIKMVKVCEAKTGKIINPILCKDCSMREL